MLQLLIKDLIIPQLIKPYHFSNLLFIVWGPVPNGGSYLLMLQSGGMSPECPNSFTC
jgi:hypothetical protein